MRFPVTIRHRSSTAKIYPPAGKFNYYRVAFTVAGKRRMQTFAAADDTFRPIIAIGGWPDCAR